MPKVLLIMNKTGNIRVLSTALEQHGYSCIGASSPDGLDETLATQSDPALALVDVSGFGQSIWAMCDKLQQEDVPFIVLSPKRDLGLSSKTLRYGATSILEKPVVKTSLLRLIDELAHSLGPRPVDRKGRLCD